MTAQQPRNPQTCAEYSKHPPGAPVPRPIERPGPGEHVNTPGPNNTAPQNIRQWQNYMDAVEVPVLNAGTVSPLTYLPQLLIGLEWLYDIEQPAGSVAHPQGQFLAGGAHRNLWFVPGGSTGNGIVVICAVPDTRAGSTPRPVENGELTALRELLDGMNEDVVTTTLAADGSTARLVLARSVHPSLSAAVQRYHAWWLEHGHCLSGADGPRRLIGVEELAARVRVRPTFTVRPVRRPTATWLFERDHRRTFRERTAAQIRREPDGRSTHRPPPDRRHRPAIRHSAG